MWTKSACVVLAWSILLIVLVTVCRQGSIRHTQANIRIASSGQVTLTSTLRGVATPVRTTSPTRKYVVQQGDTLSGIAAQLGVRGGWPALYAANRPLIGPDPDAIRAGTVLTVPVPAAPPTSKPTPPTSRPAPPKSRPAPPTSHQHPALP